MTNIICDWMTCTHNTSNEPGISGCCKLNEVELKQIEEEENDYSGDRLYCCNYKRKKAWINMK